MTPSTSPGPSPSPATSPSPAHQRPPRPQRRFSPWPTGLWLSLLTGLALLMGASPARALDDACLGATTPTPDLEDWDLLDLPSASSPAKTPPPEDLTPAPMPSRDKLPTRTQVSDPAARARLMGKHALTLQWIGAKPGTVMVTAAGDAADALLSVKGEQRDAKGNYVSIDGKIDRIDALEFTFVGTIVTQVATINQGQPCTRQGVMHFRITGSRQYWRMKEHLNTCDPCADYVDIYFK